MDSDPDLFPTCHQKVKRGGFLEVTFHFSTRLPKHNFPGGSDGKASCLQCGRPGFDPWVGKILWRRKWQPTPVLLPGKSHGWKSMVGYSPWRCKEQDTIERLHFTSLQTLGWEELMPQVSVSKSIFSSLFLCYLLGKVVLSFFQVTNSLFSCVSSSVLPTNQVSNFSYQASHFQIFY